MGLCLEKSISHRGSSWASNEHNWNPNDRRGRKREREKQQTTCPRLKRMRQGNKQKQSRSDKDEKRTENQGTYCTSPCLSVLMLIELIKPQWKLTRPFRLLRLPASAYCMMLLYLILNIQKLCFVLLYLAGACILQIPGKTLSQVSCWGVSDPEMSSGSVLLLRCRVK